MKNYFTHDEGARNDPKLIKVLMVLGQEGKGVYWDLIEMLYEQNGYLPLSECDSYAFALRTQCDTINALIRDFGLFENDGEKFWSNSLLKRLEVRKEKSVKASQSAQARWNKPKKDANALRAQSDGNAIKESKVKERRVEEEDLSLNPNRVPVFQELPPAPKGNEFETLKNKLEFHFKEEPSRVELIKGEVRFKGDFNAELIRFCTFFSSKKPEYAKLRIEDLLGHFRHWLTNPKAGVIKLNTGEPEKQVYKPAKNYNPRG